MVPNFLCVQVPGVQRRIWQLHNVLLATLVHSSRFRHRFRTRRLRRLSAYWHSRSGHSRKPRVENQTRAIFGQTGTGWYWYNSCSAFKNNYIFIHNTLRIYCIMGVVMIVLDGRWEGIARWWRANCWWTECGCAKTSRYEFESVTNMKNGSQNVKLQTCLWQKKTLCLN